MILDTIEPFDVIEIGVVPIYHNPIFDALSIPTTTLQPCEDMLRGQWKIKVIFRPSIPDNLEHWQVFNDDAQMLRFSHNM